MLNSAIDTILQQLHMNSCCTGVKGVRCTRHTAYDDARITVETYVVDVFVELMNTASFTTSFKSISKSIVPIVTMLEFLQGRIYNTRYVGEIRIYDMHGQLREFFRYLPFSSWIHYVVDTPGGTTDCSPFMRSICEEMNKDEAPSKLDEEIFMHLMFSEVVRTLDYLKRENPGHIDMIANDRSIEGAKQSLGIDRTTSPCTIMLTMHVPEYITDAYAIKQLINVGYAIASTFFVRRDMLCTQPRRITAFKIVWNKKGSNDKRDVVSALYMRKHWWCSHSFMQEYMNMIGGTSGVAAILI